MGWLWLAGILKLQVSFAKEPYKRDYILQKRPIILQVSFAKEPYKRDYILQKRPIILVHIHVERATYTWNLWSWITMRALLCDICMHVYMGAIEGTALQCVNTYIYMYWNIYINIYIYMYIFHRAGCICGQKYIYVYMCIYIYIYMCI